MAILCFLNRDLYMEKIWNSRTRDTNKSGSPVLEVLS